MAKQDMRLYFNQILKQDEPVEMVKRSIESILDQVDGCYITVTYKDKKPKKTNPLIAYLDSIGAEISFFEWVEDFSKARNFAMNQVPKGKSVYIYWHDADDVLQGVERLREAAKEACYQQWAAVFFDYWYNVELDDEGNVRNVLVNHKRERIIRNDDTFKWIGMLHETLIEQRKENVKKVARDDLVVVHLMASAERADVNLERNINILTSQLEKEDSRDPRTKIYLGKAYLDKGKMAETPADQAAYWDRALRLFHEYLYGQGEPDTPEYREPSGWPEERATAWGHIGEIAFQQKNMSAAIEAYEKAIHEAPEFPQYYIQLAMVYSAQGDYKKARHWLTLGTSFDMPDTTIITTPRDMKAQALEVDFQINLHEAKFKEALEDAQMLANLMPDNEDIQNRVEMTRDLLDYNKTAQSIVYVGKYLERAEDKEALKNLVKAIPSNMKQEKFASEMAHKFLPPKKWEDNEIAILCGPGFEEWSPKSIETGLGGSEQAVVYLSQELRDLGWDITVYANPGDEAGDHDGVQYRTWHELNPRDKFNGLILWRSIGFTDFDPEAKFTMVWMHDIPNNPDFIEERVDKVDKIAVLSEYHKGLLRMIKDGKAEEMPDEKVFLTANGTFNLESTEKHERNPHRMFYSSSPDRGLVHLLRIWPDIIKEVPDAELHVYYGFNTFDAIHKGNPSMMRWKEGVLKMLKQPGIIYHGRVGHDELHETMEKSGVWAYPTDFSEISCISAMEVQILGAIPVTTTLAALDETVQHGVKVDVDITTEDGLEEYKEELISMLTSPERQEEIREGMVPWAQDYYTWERVAKDWDELFKVHLES